jgi:PPK2 family polyphosphate:nucleotide phosphotransferase
MLDPSLFLVTPGTTPGLTNVDPGSHEGFDGGKEEGKAVLPGLTKRLAALQDRLWGEKQRAVLVVLQAMDTGGKDGTIRHVFQGVNPQGVHVRAFVEPSKWELAHDFLWRVHQQTPERGAITIFNRSHYEDVLIVRVDELVPEERWRPRFGHINDFESMLVDEGTVVVKLFLHISREEQKERLQARLDDPEKRWKFSIGDLDHRQQWHRFIEAYEEAIQLTSTDHAPWHVIPSDRKWYRNLAVSSILIDRLERMAPEFPEADPGLEEIVIP